MRIDVMTIPPERISKDEILCWECNVEIIQEFDFNYKGIRGTCPLCEVNFPLE